MLSQPYFILVGTGTVFWFFLLTEYVRFRYIFFSLWYLSSSFYWAYLHWRIWDTRTRLKYMHPVEKGWLGKFKIVIFAKKSFLNSLFTLFYENFSFYSLLLASQSMRFDLAWRTQIAARRIKSSWGTSVMLHGRLQYTRNVELWNLVRCIEIHHRYVIFFVYFYCTLFRI